MENHTIKSIYVVGLHDQFNVHLNFGPGLNIIYGKNGRGKTTVLHILANVLERDFSRFLYLQFNVIFIELGNGLVLSIESHSKLDEPRHIDVLINEERIASIVSAADQISDIASGVLDKILGPRAVYLPAFRSILERVTDSYRYAPENSTKFEYDQIVKSERALTRARLKDASVVPRRDEQAQATAAKTLQCRQWFGHFVPVIRYPSMSDVEQRLRTELRQAQLEMASVEQKVFSESFTRIFDVLATPSHREPKRSTPDLLREVSNSVGKITSKSDAGEGEIYAHILSAVRRLRQDADASPDTTNRVLALYSDLLKWRSDEQEKLFHGIEEFEDSVNKFLDGKELQVAGDYGNESYLRPIIKLPAGRKLRLSSLSSGERQVLTMIFCASRMSEGRGLFLVDEPELSLHVDWQRDILMEVSRQAGGRQVIACTHSPEVGADHPESVEFFDPTWSQSYMFSDDFSLDDESSEVRFE